MCVRNSGSWCLKQTPLRYIDRGKERDVLPPGVVTSSDLTNLYQVITFPTNDLRWVAPPGVTSLTNRPAPRNSQWGFIGRGFIPYGLPDTRIYVLWYGFASENYFSNAPEDYLHPITAEDSPGSYSKDFRVHARYKLAASTPKLPVSIQFSMYRKYMDHSALQGRKDVFESTNCLFSVKSSTNLGALTLPKVIRAEFFGFPVSSNYNISVPVGSISVLVTNVRRSLTSEDFKTPTPTNAVVSDLRPISFDAPVGVALGPMQGWPAPQVGRARYDQAVRNYLKKQQVARNRPLAWRAIFASFVICPVVLFLRRRYKRGSAKSPM